MSLLSLIFFIYFSTSLFVLLNSLNLFFVIFNFKIFLLLKKNFVSPFDKEVIFFNISFIEFILFSFVLSISDIFKLLNCPDINDLLLKYVFISLFSVLSLLIIFSLCFLLNFLSTLFSIFVFTSSNGFSEFSGVYLYKYPIKYPFLVFITGRNEFTSLLNSLE